MTERAGPRGRTAKGTDLWAGLVVAAVGVVGFVAARDIFVPRGFNDVLGPRLYPTVIALLVLVCGFALMGRAALRGSRATMDLGSVSSLLVLGAAMALYLLAFNPLGFTLATALFTTGLFWFLGERRLWLAALAGVVTAVVVDYAFTAGLSVALPVGPLGF